MTELSLQRDTFRHSCKIWTKGRQSRNYFSFEIEGMLPEITFKSDFCQRPYRTNLALLHYSDRFNRWCLLAVEQQQQQQLSGSTAPITVGSTTSQHRQRWQRCTCRFWFGPPTSGFVRDQGHVSSINIKLCVTSWWPGLASYLHTAQGRKKNLWLICFIHKSSSHFITQLFVKGGFFFNNLSWSNRY